MFTKKLNVFILIVFFSLFFFQSKTSLANALNFGEIKVEVVDGKIKEKDEKILIDYLFRMYDRGENKKIVEIVKDFEKYCSSENLIIAKYITGKALFNIGDYASSINYLSESYEIHPSHKNNKPNGELNRAIDKAISNLVGKLNLSSAGVNLDFISTIGNYSAFLKYAFNKESEDYLQLIESEYKRTITLNLEASKDFDGYVELEAWGDKYNSNTRASHPYTRYEYDGEDTYYLRKAI